LTFEDGLQIFPLGLHGNKDLEGLSDLGDSALPVINIGVEFFVERRALGCSESLAMVFNKFHDVVNLLDEKVVFVVCLGFLFGDDEVRCLALIPLVANVLEQFFNLQLFVSIVSDFQDHGIMVKEIKAHDFFEIEVFALLIEIFFDLDSQLFPMSVSDGFLQESLSK
jgi:hypothetical protein